MRTSYRRNTPVLGALISALLACLPVLAAPVSVVEFNHQAFDHQFLTASPTEATKLDATPAMGWARTWTSYKVDDTQEPGLSPVCRFFSNAYAPKSSHFFTAVPEECELVKANPVWTYEGVAFYAKRPDGLGNCPAGTLAIHRGYTWQDGCPVHRYSPWPDEICGGHTGCLDEGVAFCVPVSPDIALERTQRLANSTWEFVVADPSATRTLRIDFGNLQAGNPWQSPPRYMLDLPYGVPTSSGGVAGWDPLASVINVLVRGWLYQFDFTGRDGLSGCAFAFDDLFDPTHGRCISVTGRRQ